MSITPLPAVVPEPGSDTDRPLSRIEMIRISLYWLALSGLWAGISLQLNPVIAQHLICPVGVSLQDCANVPTDQLIPGLVWPALKPEIAIGVVGLVGSVVAFVVQPIAAALSDYTRSRLGRRRPWILVGTALDVVFLIALANAQTYLAFAILITLLQFSRTSPRVHSRDTSRISCRRARSAPLPASWDSCRSPANSSAPGSPDSR